MPLQPNIPKQKRAFLTKECPRCKQQQLEEDFTKTHSIFYPDGVLPICNDCITHYLKQNEFSWRADSPFSSMSRTPKNLQSPTNSIASSPTNSSIKVFVRLFLSIVFSFS